MKNLAGTWKIDIANGFYRTSSYPSAVLAIAILSVCPSVSLSHEYFVTNPNSGYFDITRKGDHSSFLTPKVVGRQRPDPSEICAQSEPPLQKTGFDRFPLITSQS